MELGFKRLSVRSVNNKSIQRLRALRSYTRLPLGALLEDAIDAWWEKCLADGLALHDESGDVDLHSGCDDRPRP
jgi:hypothetical protein